MSNSLWYFTGNSIQFVYCFISLSRDPSRLLRGTFDGSHKNSTKGSTRFVLVGSGRDRGLIKVFLKAFSSLFKYSARPASVLNHCRTYLTKKASAKGSWTIVFQQDIVTGNLVEISLKYSARYSSTKKSLIIDLSNKINYNPVLFWFGIPFQSY